jgi:integrase
MSTVFKRGGKTNRHGHYIASWHDENGKRVSRTTRTADYDSACRIAGKWETETALRKSGIINTSQAKIADHNLIPITRHIADYIEHCKHIGQAKAHWFNKTTQLRKFVEATGVSRLSDIEPHKVERYLASIVKAGNSHRSHNQHRSTILAFMQWCFERGRIASNNLGIVPTLNENKDRRRVRRAMLPDELSRLFAVSAERSLYYQFAYLTGLRVRAVKAATWGDIDLDGAVLRVKVAHAKGKKSDLFLPLHQSIVALLRSVKPAFARSEDRIFASVPTVKTFHKDCEQAGIVRYDSEGRQLDRHALRTSLGTNLALAGVLPQMAMRILGHASINTTMKHYTALRLADTGKAMNTLPAIPLAGPANASNATGTDDRRPPSK